VGLSSPTDPPVVEIPAGLEICQTTSAEVGFVKPELGDLSSNFEGSESIRVGWRERELDWPLGGTFGL
jgi:hypothetical protein